MSAALLCVWQRAEDGRTQGCDGGVLGWVGMDDVDAGAGLILEEVAAA